MEFGHSATAMSKQQVYTVTDDNTMTCDYGCSEGYFELKVFSKQEFQQTSRNGYSHNHKRPLTNIHYYNLNRFDYNSCDSLQRIMT